MNKPEAFVIGVDYGTDSVRTIVVDVHDGREIASSVYYYPRWKKQLFCNAVENQFRQHPLDYVEGLEHTIKDCVNIFFRVVLGQITACASGGCSNKKFYLFFCGALRLDSFFINRGK
jgi:hypothetical protein